MSNPINESNDVSFVKSNKEEQLLIMNDNIYRCSKKTDKCKYWKCMVRGCMVIVHTDKNYVYKRGGKTDHDHPPNIDLIKKNNFDNE